MSVTVDAPPAVTIGSPANGAVFAAGANITIAATASDSVGNVTKVDFYQGTTLLGTATASPYSFTWTSVPAGSYSLTAVATNDGGGTATSAAVSITVNPAGASIYYIETDHLNTPRMIADQAGNTVWRNDNTEPFGDSVPNGDPNNTGTTFEFNLRFPGQYFDREIGLSYNGFRDYDAGIGRYPESDPIGLKAGLNTYAYVGGDPLRRIDPAGLAEIAEPPVKTPPVRPPSNPPSGDPGGGPDCYNIPPWSILVTRGGIWGFLRTVTVQCSYYCPPPGCPANPGDYVYQKTFYDQLQIAPWLSPCPPKAPRSTFF